MSEKTSHTAGPWRVNPLGSDYESNLIFASTTADGKRRLVSSVATGADAPANSRLIAAAPDLLEALKWYVENDDTNIGMEGNEFWEAGLERGKAAIKKATVA